MGRSTAWIVRDAVRANPDAAARDAAKLAAQNLNLFAPVPLGC